MDPTINISPFTQEEDDLLSFLVDKYGEGQWALIAQFTPGRNDYIIRKRWDELMNGINTIFECLLVFCLIIYVIFFSGY